MLAVAVLVLVVVWLIGVALRPVGWLDPANTAEAMEQFLRKCPWVREMREQARSMSKD